jgi:single-strand DNA-binding protein
MLNNVSLTGRLTKEPEVFKTAADLEPVRFTLVVWAILVEKHKINIMIFSYFFF